MASLAVNFFQLARIYFEERMDVVRHHYPCAQLVALAMEKPKCALYDAGNFRMPQVALASPQIKVGFQPRPAFLLVFNFN